MTAAIVVLSMALLAAVGGLIALSVALRSALADSRASMTVEGIASRQQLVAERDRDAAIGGKRQAEAERDAALVQLAATQQQAAASREEWTRRVQARLDSGNSADAFGFLNQLLGEKLPGVFDAAAAVAGDTAADGPRDAVAGPVSRPPKSAVADPFGGDS